MHEELGQLGRLAAAATLILSSLADGAKHGYGLTKDIEDFAGVRLRPGTLYAALTRLVERGLIEPVEGDGRRKPYQLTAHGEQVLADHLALQRRVVDVGQRRLEGRWAAS